MVLTPVRVSPVAVLRYVSSPFVQVKVMECVNHCKKRGIKVFPDVVKIRGNPPAVPSGAHSWPYSWVDVVHCVQTFPVHVGAVPPVVVGGCAAAVAVPVTIPFSQQTEIE